MLTEIVFLKEAQLNQLTLSLLAQHWNSAMNLKPWTFHIPTNWSQKRILLEDILLDSFVLGFSFCVQISQQKFNFLYLISISPPVCRKGLFRCFISLIVFFVQIFKIALQLPFIPINSTVILKTNYMVLCIDLLSY